MSRSVIAVAGPTGDLGARIVKALVQRGAEVRALVHDAGDETRVRGLGAAPVRADPRDAGAMSEAVRGATCVVSALNGLRDVIIDRQGVLLEAALRAGVPRFIPSDFSEDFTKTIPGQNRNLDLRREFMARADAAPIACTSILNGAFMDMLGEEMPLIQPRIRRVLYWESADQKLDFTTKDDTAAYTAAVAMEAQTPRILRIAGDSVSARELAAVMSELTGERYKTLPAGNLATLSAMIAVAKVVAPQPGKPFPPWQGMQYMRDMFSGRGKLEPLNNGRHSLRFTTVRAHLAAKFAPAARAA